MKSVRKRDMLYKKRYDLIGNKYFKIYYNENITLTLQQMNTRYSCFTFKL